MNALLLCRRLTLWFLFRLRRVEASFWFSNFDSKASSAARTLQFVGLCNYVMCVCVSHDFKRLRFVDGKIDFPCSESSAVKWMKMVRCTRKWCFDGEMSFDVFVLENKLSERVNLNMNIRFDIKQFAFIFSIVYLLFFCVQPPLSLTHKWKSRFRTTCISSYKFHCAIIQYRTNF